MDESEYPDSKLTLDWDLVEFHEGDDHPDDEIADHTEEDDDGA